jgi:hypothetical protein
VRAALLILLVACGGKKDDKPPPPPTPTGPELAPVKADREALLAGRLPEGAPESDLINAQCAICHSTEYLTQQRLGEAGWKKTIDKMRKFGANLNDEDAARLVTFVSTYWNGELPDRPPVLVEPPAGALP